MIQPFVVDGALNCILVTNYIRSSHDCWMSQQLMIWFFFSRYLVVLCQQQVMWTEWSQTMFVCFFVLVLNQLMPPSPSCSVYMYTWLSNFICILCFQTGIVKMNGSVGDFCPVKVHKQLPDVLRIFRLLVLEVVFSIIIFISPKKCLKCCIWICQ